MTHSRTCYDFRPDHNGECLNCDDWADAHPVRDPLPDVIEMAKDWTDPAVVRDAPERAANVIEQLIAWLLYADRTRKVRRPRRSAVTRSRR